MTMLIGHIRAVCALTEELERRIKNEPYQHEVLQEAVNLQITVNRIVAYLNKQSDDTDI